MRLADMSSAFADGRPKRGLDMEVTVEGGVSYLRYKTGAVIATISNRKPHSYTLTLFRLSSSIYHANRIAAVLRACQNGYRYSSFVRYHVKVRDSKMSAEISLTSSMQFQNVNGTLRLDYDHLERMMLNEGEGVEVEETTINNTVTNESKAAVAQLMSAVADI